MSPGRTSGLLPSATAALFIAVSDCTVSIFRLVNTHNAPVAVTLRSTAAGGANAALGPVSLSLDPGCVLDVFSDGEVLPLSPGDALTGLASVGGVVEYLVGVV